MAQITKGAVWMLFMLEEIMTPREPCDRWRITQEALRMKLKRGKDNKLVDGLIKSGKIKYYKPEEKQRREWILTVEAMDFLFPKNRKKVLDFLYNKVNNIYSLYKKIRG
jgi:hypothetical protein